jgi:hypothetical protein
VTQLTSFFNPSTTADPRARGSVRRASGFVQIALALVGAQKSEEKAQAGEKAC